jgi:tripartite-type tricarboxylate transporter receptor subunit TctC
MTNRLWTRRQALRTMAGVPALAAFPALSQANDEWPAKPIRVVVPVAAGGIIDLLTRAVGEALTPKLGVPLVVESRPGADHLIGIQNVAHSAPDGYTWLSASIPFTVNVALRNNPGYDAVKDFKPLALIATSPNVLVVPPSVPAGNMKEFIALAKSKPGHLTYGNPGNGSSNHLGMELLKTEAGVDIMGIPYKGQPPAISDLLAGRVDSMLMSVSLAVPYLQAGKLRALALVAPERAAALPDVPTMRESGYPGVDVLPWFGLLAPGGTPDAIVGKVSADMQAAMNEPKLRTAIERIGATPFAGGTSARFAQLIQGELSKWPSVISRAGIGKI